MWIVQLALRRPYTFVVAALLLSGGGAAKHVVGHASPGPGDPVDVPPDAFPITGATDSPIGR